MERRIVAAIGGNALGETLPEQYRAVTELGRVLGGLLRPEDRLVVVHGSGPQVGMISRAMTAMTRQDPPRATSATTSRTPCGRRSSAGAVPGRWSPC